MKSSSVSECKFIKTELDTLCSLLQEHIDDGSYWGRKDQHYKMIRELLIKLEDMYEK